MVLEVSSVAATSVSQILDRFAQTSSLPLEAQAHTTYSAVSSKANSHAGVCGVQLDKKVLSA